ncbi:MAG: ribosome maturation factor RimP, partial [Erysipelotrichaceae bacterium]|nr:ribosome maturation factor RimP [Erysipelotrichaceae bacterium]
DWYTKEYNLEVCSPGAERPLKTEKQITGAIGSYVYAKLKDPKQGIADVTGDLKENREESIVIEYKEKTRKKSIEIDKSNLKELRTAVKV